MIKLQVQKGISNLNGEKSEYYKVGIVTGAVITQEKIARKISDKLKVVDSEVVKMVLSGMMPVIFDELEDGQSVQLGGVTLQPSISVKTHKTAEECSAKDVRQVRFVANTTGEFQKMRKSITFSLGGKTAEVTPSGDIVSEGDGQTNTDETDEVPAASDTEGESPAGDSSNTTNGNTQQGDGSNTPTDPTKILLLFNDGAHGNVIVKRMEVAPGYQLQASDLPDGYVYAFKSDDQADIDAATAGEAVWVTLAPRG